MHSWTLKGVVQHTATDCNRLSVIIYPRNFRWTAVEQRGQSHRCLAGDDCAESTGRRQRGTACCGAFCRHSGTRLSSNSIAGRTCADMSTPRASRRPATTVQRAPCAVDGHTYAAGECSRIAPVRSAVPSCLRKEAVRRGEVGPPDSAWALMTLMGMCVLSGAGAIDDVLSYKSLVLGSLSSGERVSGRVRISPPIHVFSWCLTATGTPC